MSNTPLIARMKKKWDCDTREARTGAGKILLVEATEAQLQALVAEHVSQAVAEYKAENTKLRKIAEHISPRTYIEAKESAGYGKGVRVFSDISLQEQKGGDEG